jgi:hypothetical protein
LPEHIGELELADTAEGKGFTVTATVEVAEPHALVAVKVYVPA